MRQSRRAEAGFFLLALKVGIKLFDLGFELRDFIVERSRAVGDDVRLFFEEHHGLRLTPNEKGDEQTNDAAEREQQRPGKRKAKAAKRDELLMCQRVDRMPVFGGPWRCGLLRWMGERRQLQPRRIPLHPGILDGRQRTSKLGIEILLSPAFLVNPFKI